MVNLSGTVITQTIRGIGRDADHRGKKKMKTINFNKKCYKERNSWQ